MLLLYVALYQANHEKSVWLKVPMQAKPNAQCILRRQSLKTITGMSLTC